MERGEGEGERGGASTMMVSTGLATAARGPLVGEGLGLGEGVGTGEGTGGAGAGEGGALWTSANVTRFLTT